MTEPIGHRFRERAQSARGKIQIRFQQPIKLQQRLVIEANEVQVTDRDARL